MERATWRYLIYFFGLLQFLHEVFQGHLSWMSVALSALPAKGDGLNRPLLDIGYGR